MVTKTLLSCREIKSYCTNSHSSRRSSGFLYCFLDCYQCQYKPIEHLKFGSVDIQVTRNHGSRHLDFEEENYQQLEHMPVISQHSTAREGDIKHELQPPPLSMNPDDDDDDDSFGFCRALCRGKYQQNDDRSDWTSIQKFPENLPCHRHRCHARLSIDHHVLSEWRSMITRVCDQEKEDLLTAAGGRDLNPCVNRNDDSCGISSIRGTSKHRFEIKN